MKWVCMFLVVGVCLGIKMPIKANQQRCMVIFTYVHGDTVKLNIKFPKVPDQKEGELWHVVIENRDTQQKQNREFVSGHFKQELFPSQSSLYNLCYKFSGADREQTFFVDFEANLHFNVNPTKITVPQSLSKVKDVKRTYQQVEKMLELGDRFLQVQGNRTIQEDEYFTQTAATGEKLIIMLRAQVLVLVILMLFQLAVIRKWVRQEQTQ